MKKVLSVILAASLITSLFAACGTEKKSGDSHTLCFRDASKSKEAVATFFNSDTGESTEVKMERGSEDDEAVTFTCEGNTSEYNMAYITYDSIPYVQEHYNVYADAEHTSIAGTSLGGLGAFYITMEIPDKIGTAGALSPSFWTYDDKAWKSFLSEKTLDKTVPFVYIYTGGKNDTGKEAREMYERLKDMGYPQEKLAFHYNENGGHSVPFWRAIFPEFLEAAMFGHVDVLQK